MISFRRPLDGQDFAWGAAVRNGAFVAITLAFPFALRAAIEVSGCRGIGGACGALALVLAIYAKPLIFAVFVLSYATILARRLRDAGLMRWLAAGIALLMLGSVQWAMVIGAPWSVAFVTGFMGGHPISLMAGLALIVTLCVMGSMPAAEIGTAPSRRTLDIRAWLFLGLLLAGAALALLGLVGLLRGRSMWLIVSMHRGMLAPLAIPAKIALAATPLVLGLFCYREWEREGRFGAGSLFMYPIAACAAAVMAGALVMTATTAWSSLAVVFALRGSLLPAQVMHFAGLAELIGLLALPWLLSMLPRGPVTEAAYAPGPVRRPAGGSQTRPTAPAGSVAFGRRGLR